MSEDHDAHVGTYADHLRAQFHAAFHGRIGRVPDVLVRKARKNGAPEWRWIGKAGASYATHPLDAAHHRMEENHRAELAKVERNARLPTATQAASARREARGAATQAAVLSLADRADMRKKNGRPDRKKITHEMGKAGHPVGYSRVCRIISEAAKSRATETG